MKTQKLEKLLNILIDPYYRNTLTKFRVAASIEHEKTLQSFEKENLQLIVDIGANRGQFALVARKHFPDAKIISFEPLSKPSAIFLNIFADDPRVFLYEMAIGPETKETKMHVSFSDDSSSLLPISNHQNNLFPGTSEKETCSVQVKPLDAVLNAKDITSPALLKMDVQGYEREALEGCKSLLPLFAYIYVECSFVELYTDQSLASEIIVFLHDEGFELIGIYNLSNDKNGKAIQGDFLFENRKKRKC